jgi:hypothetical protein
MTDNVVLVLGPQRKTEDSFTNMGGNPSKYIFREAFNCSSLWKTGYKTGKITFLCALILAIDCFSFELQSLVDWH